MMAKSEKERKGSDSGTSAEDGLHSNGESMDELLGREAQMKCRSTRRQESSCLLAPWKGTQRRPTLNVMPLHLTLPFSFTFISPACSGESFTGKILKLHFSKLTVCVRRSARFPWHSHSQLTGTSKTKTTKQTTGIKSRLEARGLKTPYAFTLAPLHQRYHQQLLLS